MLVGILKGSMVMNTEKECDKAYRDFSEGFFGVPWDNRLNDDEWREVNGISKDRSIESEKSSRARSKKSSHVCCCFRRCTMQTD